MDDCSGIQIDFQSITLPAVDPEPAPPVGGVVGNVVPATVLNEYVCTVEMRFYVPSALRRYLLFSRLPLGMLLVVRVPTIAWYTQRYTRFQVFEALCEEINTATFGVEADADRLVFMMASIIC